jgi:hypothetical protein
MYVNVAQRKSYSIHLIIFPEIAFFSEKANLARQNTVLCALIFQNFFPIMKPRLPDSEGVTNHYSLHNLQHFKPPIV